ncbi:MAG TPA: hypothetical protein VF173_00965 [Thermoanaerobaculia bacterium]|nr:hypothetical protein [Thermoanaerobaculia bacterium]
MKRYTVCMLALVALLAASAARQAAAQPPPIVRGVDVFQTSTGASPTFFDFSSNPIPAGFFCAGSPPFTGVITFKGVPLATSPAGVAANGDTLVERLANGVFPATGGTATIPLIVRALRLAGTSNISISCPGAGTTTWRVSTCLCGTQPTTNIVVGVDQTCGCGHFNGALQLNVCVTFTNVATGAVAGPIHQAIRLNVVNSAWCPTPGPGEPVIATSFRVDTNCDGVPDLSVPGTTNFHKGWTCGNQGVDCLTQYANLTECHDGPTVDDQHCTNPMCDRSQ